MESVQRQIHDYLDGNLPQEMEQDLFQMLSDSDELRNEFSAQLSIQQKASEDAKLITAPNDIKADIFSQIGLPYPTTTSIPTPLPSQSITSKAFSTSGIVLTLLLALFTGAYSTWFLLSGSNTANKVQTKREANLLPVSSILNTGNPTIFKSNDENIPTITNYLEEDNSFTPKKTSVMISEVGHNTNSADTTEQVSTSEFIINNTTIQNCVLMEQPYFSSFLHTNTHNSIYTFSNITEPLSENIEFTISSLTPFSDKSQTSYIIQCLYELNNETFIGVEYSNGTYSYENNSLIDGVDQIEISQKNTHAVSIAFQYKPSSLQLFGNITPLFQLSTGGTTTGEPIARSSMALQWKPEQRISLMLGVGVSAIGYREQSTWKSTFNTGLITGVNIQL